MSKTYAYCRVSSDDQSLDVQVEKLTKYGCDVLFQEKVSGKSMDGRDELKLILRVIGKGDLLIVTRTDRLGRDMLDQCMTVKTVDERGAGILAIDEGIDTRTEQGRFYFHLMSVIAEQERRRIRARQADGIVKAKEKGTYKGGKKKFDPTVIQQMLDEGKRPHEIKDELGCSFDTITRAARLQDMRHQRNGVPMPSMERRGNQGAN